ncbi:MAG: glucosaminidase domain-containing protein [Candidatus Moraniibacteriota bacterium]|nr:MAG: glucosaminidase domain-containing protein [Candidatus Moranbacteria bacterium]
MSKTKHSPSMSFFQRSDWSHIFLAGFLFVALGVTVFVSSFGKYAADEISEMRLPKSFFELKLQALVFGHPMRKMVPALLEQDRDVAVFLVAIAKKESNWGSVAPQKDGRDCYNYWGYRGPENTTASGYSCFASPQEAVVVVGARLRTLMIDQGLDTPRKLVVWKRGFLDAPLDLSEEKWVSDVAYYVGKFSK